MIEQTFTPIANCKSNLNFLPAQIWPDALPPYAFQGELLCGFDLQKGYAINLIGNTPVDFIKLLHPQLSFFELARLHHKIKKWHNSMDANESKCLLESLWSLYGYKLRDSLVQTIDIAVNLPHEVQLFGQQKKWNPQDLSPLRAVSNLNILNSFWKSLITSSLSKTDATRALELFVELTLMEFPDESINLKTNESANDWLKRLHETRYPISTTQDAQAEQLVKKVHWPLRSEARWLRKGDLSGIELKIFFTHPTELKKALIKLDQVNQDLQNETQFEDLWNRI